MSEDTFSWLIGWTLGLGIAAVIATAAVCFCVWLLRLTFHF